MKKYLLLISFFFLLGSVFGEQIKNSISMPAIFSDNMVLQQKSNVSFWGKAKPDLKVVVKASWKASAKTKVDSDGNWMLKLKTPKAGGPYTVSVQIGDSTINYKNVLIGEVWLCSGQSNMEMSLAGWPPSDTIANSAQEIKDANYSSIRFFTVTQAYSHQPEYNCIGTWNECTPEAAAKFSATAFFFGKKLAQDLKVPIGLIHSSWGGTAVQPWISGKSISQVDQYKDLVKKIVESSPQLKLLDEWLKNHPVIDVNSRPAIDKWKNIDLQDAECANPNFNDESWHVMKLPTLWETTEAGDLDGVVWFRNKVEIPKSWIGKELVIEIGAVDDMDETFVNGVKVGEIMDAGFWQTQRSYPVPADLVKDSVLYLAIRVLDTQGGGGVYGDPAKMKISLKGSDEKISIAGDWKYLVVAQYLAGKFYLFGTMENEYSTRPKLSVQISSGTPTALYNAMIAPLVPYNIKGAIWYQGEANVGQSELYKTLFPMMIKDWRQNWHVGNFPFYYVQIAPWSYSPGSKSQLIREAQMVSLATPKTGMAVTMDIGSPKTIHPPYKKEVGERLALWALAKDYSKKVVYSGPIYKSMKVENDKIVLSFNYAGNGLVLQEKNGVNNFLVAGDDKKFRKADVKIDGKKLMVSSPEVQNPVAVRYGWDDYADGTLFNKEGLPASSFRTDNWEE